MVFVIGLHEPPPFVLLSHLTTLPVCPDKVKVPELLPLQTVAELFTVPATVRGTIVAVIAVLDTVVHPLLVAST